MASIAGCLFLHASISDQIRHRERVVRATVKVPVDLCDALLHAFHKVAQGAQAVLILRAVVDASERDDGVVQHEANEGLFLGRLAGGGARENLAVQAGGERRDGVHVVGLEMTTSAQTVS